MKISVRVPATSANLGPGFDSFGLALPIYNTVTIEETVLPGTGIEINLLSDEDDTIQHIATDESSIIYKAIELLYNSIGQNPNEIRVSVKTGIPIAKGLGSSASVIVGGILAANELLGKPADEAALLSIATEVEGHPDNITPAIVGGVTMSSFEEDGSVIYRKLPWPKDWKVTVCIPDYELATDISRSVLPSEIKIEDAIFNLRRSAMFVDALYNEDADLMKLAMRDRIHQPYRKVLVPGLVQIIDNLRHTDGIIGAALSGAGPSMIIVSQKNTDIIKDIVTNTWEALNVTADVRTLPVEFEGAKIIQ